jgi:hypothetical protein
MDESDSRFDEFDIISDLRVINNGEAIRITQMRKKQPYFIDIELFDNSITVRKADKYEDKGIFKYGLSYVKHHESLNKFIAYQ